MTTMIVLTPDLETALMTCAEQQNTTVELLVLQSLYERFAAPDHNGADDSETDSLASFLEGYIGVVHSSEYVPGGARMSEDTGWQFASGRKSSRWTPISISTV